MKATLALAVSAGSALLSTVNAQGVWPTELVGTWSTKSNKTLTGPGFYDPVKDEFIEPSRTGFSYSFTADGHFEEAYYRAIANPTNPQCPSGIMQWQHGSWTQNANGSLTLTPIAVDGRQLLSTPCRNDNGIYTRYNQTELFKTYQVYTDPYHKIPRLDLFQFDGAPLNPMYLVYSPPQMLPVSTLNPTSTATSAGTKSTVKVKRSEMEVPINWKMGSRKTIAQHAMNPDWWWWMGMGFTGVGGLLYFGPRRMGISI
ncbi:chaperone for protein-folding within the ER, fungal-domain-containing protein [Elsinoe ampelina]|uniref:Protein ROT1 n=1 Tax=Elsinoe ampelina TaxID=302913 RepID=A0A6A6G228_9PEZI|nr:chaperone for protein-folding within the ER, fungal-domain-containing protein [Elsinoe ampelina]